MEILNILKTIGVIYVLCIRLTKKVSFLKIYILSTHFIYITKFSIINQLEVFLYIISSMKLGDKIILINSLKNSCFKEISIFLTNLLFKYIFNITTLFKILIDGFIYSFCILLIILFSKKLKKSIYFSFFEKNLFRKFNHIFMFYILLKYGKSKILRDTIDLLSLFFGFLDCFFKKFYLNFIYFLIKKETDDIGSFYCIQLYLKCFSIPLYLLKYDDVIIVAITICIFDTIASISGLFFKKYFNQINLEKKTWIGTIFGLISSLITHFIIFKTFKRMELYFIIAILEKYTLFIEDNFILSLFSTGYLFLIQYFK